jgi:hypothetical protein
MPDFTVGLTIGFLQSAIGHPFDTAKTLLQNGQRLRGLAPLQYYRGVTYPTCASLAFNAIVFPVFDDVYGRTQNPFAAGAVAGLAVGPVDFAFTIGKVRRQTLSTIPLHARGLFASYARNITAASLYFGVYSHTTEHTGPLVAGAMAGLANWTFTYPLDVVSTRQIAQGLRLRDAWYGNVWRGYLPCALRAVLVNSATFYCYEWFRK